MIEYGDDKMAEMSNLELDNEATRKLIEQWTEKDQVLATSSKNPKLHQ